MSLSTRKLFKEMGGESPFLSRKTMTTSASFPDTPPEPNPVNCIEPGEIHFMLTLSQICVGIRVIGLPVSIIALYGSVQASEVFSRREAINLIKRVEMPTARSSESSLVSNSKSILARVYELSRF